MKKLILLVVFCCHAQILSVPFTTSPAGGAPVFGTPTAVSNGQGASTGSFTVTKTTTAGDLVVLGASSSATCSGQLSSSGFQLPTHTPGTDAITPVWFPNAEVVGIQVTAGGTLYASVPTCSISNCGAASCTANISGGAVVSADIVTSLGACTAPAAVSFGGPGSGATAIISAYGQPAAGGTDYCSMMWQIKNNSGVTSDVFTPPADIYGAQFSGLSVAEVSGASTTAPFDVGIGANASATPITTGSFTTTNANEIVFCFSRVENLSNTWTAGTNYTRLAASEPGSGNNFQSMEYRILTTGAGLSQTASYDAGSSGVMNMICAAFTH